MSACNCIGPQNGEPVCPCKMNKVRVVDGRYVIMVDIGPCDTSEGIKSRVVVNIEKSEITRNIYSKNSN